jgi:hypothetical protein
MDLVGLCVPSEETRYKRHSPTLNEAAFVLADRLSAHGAMDIAHLGSSAARNYLP